MQGRAAYAGGSDDTGQKRQSRRVAVGERPARQLPLSTREKHFDKTPLCSPPEGSVSTLQRAVDLKGRLNDGLGNA